MLISLLQNSEETRNYWIKISIMITEQNNDSELSEATGVEVSETTADTESNQDSEQVLDDNVSDETLSDEISGVVNETEVKKPQGDGGAKEDFLRKDESVRLDFQLLKSEGKGNLQALSELKESKVYPESIINRLKKLVINGSLDAPEEREDSEKDRFSKWQADEMIKSEKKEAIKWYPEFIKELGINSGTNSVAINSRKNLIKEANDLYNQTIPEKRNFKRSLQLASAHLGLNNSIKNKEAIRKAVRTKNTSVSSAGTPQKMTKNSYTKQELADILSKDKERGLKIIRLQRLKKLKLTD